MDERRDSAARPEQFLLVRVSVEGTVIEAEELEDGARDRPRELVELAKKLAYPKPAWVQVPVTYLLRFRKAPGAGAESEGLEVHRWNDRDNLRAFVEQLAPDRVP